MKKGFTMIELIFVIVILGILAAVAIPKLAATRDDAKAASIKTDIGTAMQAVPAWYQGQKEASFLKAMTLDTNVWKQAGTTCSYVYTDGASGKVTMSIFSSNVDENGTTVGTPAILTACDITAPATLGNAPFLRIQLAPGTVDIVHDLNASLGVASDANISMGGKKVKW